MPDKIELKSLLIPFLNNMRKLRIKVINPNTSLDMTKKIEKAVKRYSRPDTEITAVSPDTGPSIIGCRYDNALAMPGTLMEIKKGIKEGYDGFVVAAFIDTALYEAREPSNVPVIGIAVAAMHMSCMLGYKFSIVTILDRMVPLIDELVTKYGFKEKCASIRVIEANMMAYKNNPESIKKAIGVESVKAIKEDGAEVIILG